METLANLTIGTKLESTKQYPQCGVYSDIVITDIKETKTGRLSVTYKYIYTSVEGEKKIGTKKIGYNALDKCTLLSGYCLRIK